MKSLLLLIVSCLFSITVVSASLHAHEDGENHHESCTHCAYFAQVKVVLPPISGADLCVENVKIDKCEIFLEKKTHLLSLCPSTNQVRAPPC